MDESQLSPGLRSLLAIVRQVEADRCRRGGKVSRRVPTPAPTRAPRRTAPPVVDRSVWPLQGEGFALILDEKAGPRPR